MEQAEIRGEITNNTKQNANNSNRFDDGSKLDLTASEAPMPNINMGIVSGKINNGEIILPDFEPKVRDEHIEPIIQKHKLPIKKIIKFQKIIFKSKLSKIENIGTKNDIGINKKNQKTKHFINTIISKTNGE